MPDATVVGAGPNGLAAAVVMARAGLSVEVFEAAATIGGGTRTVELMQPEHFHDVCSAVHPMALASPFFRAFELSRRVDLVSPDLSYGSPLDGGRSALAYKSLDRTAAGLGRDGAAYRRLMQPLVRNIDDVMDFTQNQLFRIPRNPLAAGIFGARTVEQGSGLWNLRFKDQLAPALLSGVAAHAISHLPSLAASGAGLMLGALGHAQGWPIPLGGSAAIAAALAKDIEAHGGVIHTNTPINRLSDLPPARATLLDVAPRGLLNMAGDSLPDRYRKSLESFRYGNGSCKVDFILSGPVPWAAAELTDAGTVHVGGTRAELAHSENEVSAGRHPEQPYVLVAQPSRFDSGRAPAGRHTLWTYCHVPAGSTKDMTEAITAQLERFAPGFRDLVLDTNVVTAAQLEDYNRNYIGGDFSVGVMDMRGLVQRPVVSRHPWRTPLPGVYLCSSATPPGPGVTGMPGYHAATYALKDIFGQALPPLGVTAS
ncbi:phytoene dehydrogenase-like oxidoreductase [Pseudarthrobacter phenanthrenivorans Sphe3]|uniref:Phytoene dehydrogenase-like oxidoreductase n=1 Tax=Pseudarthrobacter phenanthrenivorans (strain DSM 18606 / JCM 16027 / LMG 23796 / Sphe3) TaxID=930171 RepID=F0MA64_PSEPM|nr:NAD(P)/FAD-dependent oxidoreductase [Pseudarthrobacter phenanthrenivorans]ADX75051.1 phytoene dehydrogenase-like oxidoreductase [Pseudarthrobacter phenanthrenivorans Sphe3]